MPKKAEKEPAEDPEDRGGRWLFNFAIWLLVSPAAIVGSIATGYVYGVLFGIVLALWRVWATPEITNYLSVKLNWKSRTGKIGIRDSPGAQAAIVQGNRNQVLLG